MSAAEVQLYAVIDVNHRLCDRLEQCLAVQAEHMSSLQDFSGALKDMSAAMASRFEQQDQALCKMSQVLGCMCEKLQGSCNATSEDSTQTKQCQVQTEQGQPSLDFLVQCAEDVAVEPPAATFVTPTKTKPLMYDIATPVTGSASTECPGSETCRILDLGDDASGFLAIHGIESATCAVVALAAAHSLDDKTVGVCSRACNAVKTRIENILGDDMPTRASRALDLRYRYLDRAACLDRIQPADLALELVVDYRKGRKGGDAALARLHYTEREGDGVNFTGVAEGKMATAFLMVMHIMGDRAMAATLGCTCTTMEWAMYQNLNDIIDRMGEQEYYETPLDEDPGWLWSSDPDAWWSRCAFWREQRMFWCRLAKREMKQTLRKQVGRRSCRDEEMLLDVTPQGALKAAGFDISDLSDDARQFMCERATLLSLVAKEGDG